MGTMVRLIGSPWHGSRLPAPKRDIPEYGLKLKLRGEHNFRVIEQNGELVAIFLGQLANDLVGPNRRRYDDCQRCNYDEHTCPGCGEALSHDGIQLGKGEGQGFPHGTRCVE